MKRRGAYISLDGADGAGKSTLAAKLAESTSSYLAVEPGGHTKVLREILLGREINLTPEAEVLLFSADRNLTIKHEIEPRLNTGTSVVSDRSFLSTITYQCYGRGVDLNSVWQVTNFAIQGVVPDMSVFVDVPVEIAAERILAQGRITGKDRFEEEDKSFKERVRQGGLTLAREMGTKALILDGSGTIDEAFKQLYDEVGELLLEGVIVDA